MESPLHGSLTLRGAVDPYRLLEIQVHRSIIYLLPMRTGENACGRLSSLESRTALKTLAALPAKFALGIATDTLVLAICALFASLICLCPPLPGG